MRIKYSYVVQTEMNEAWYTIPGATNKLTWCEGYVACADDHYPSKGFRILRNDGKVMHLSESKQGLKLP